ncbi:MAG TPA: CmcI family methyltransferase [Burkholderiales bacterium]|nr:CmcI family methyltransferase [Burkholderiales bacterium]
MKKRTAVLLAILAIAAGALFYSRAIRPRASETPDERVVKEFTRLYHSVGIHYRTSWLGVTTLENPCDMWAIQEIIAETNPDFIIETGT